MKKCKIHYTHLQTSNNKMVWYRNKTPNVCVQEGFLESITVSIYWLITYQIVDENNKIVNHCKLYLSPKDLKIF